MLVAPKAASVWPSKLTVGRPLADLFRKGSLILQRLKNRPQFQAVLAGLTLSRTPHFALHCLVLDAPTPLTTKPPLFGARDVWLGAMVPKRWAKRAVTRNAIKRQIYAVSQGFEPVLQQAAHVVRLRSGFDKTRYVSATSDALKVAVREELQQLFERATAVASQRMAASSPQGVA
jgi:ribonuclease P protein component